MLDKSQTANNWLNRIFENRQNGVLLDSNDFNSFDLIQNFIAAKDHSTKTPAIYYQAFADDDLEELVSILEEELRLKLGFALASSCSEVSQVISRSELKTVILDRSHLYTKEMIDGLWQWLAKHQVNLILIASLAEVFESEILNHPAVSQWDKFLAYADQANTLSSGCCCLLVTG